MAKLYDLAGNFASVFDKLTDALENGSEYADKDGIRAELDDAKEELSAKLENCARLIKNLAADASALELEKNRLQRKQDAAEGSIRWVKDYMKAAMERAGVDKIKGAVFSPRLQLNGQASVECNAKLDKLPPEFVRKIPAKLELDKDAVLALWKAKEKLPEGIIVTQGRHVRF